MMPQPFSVPAAHDPESSQLLSALAADMLSISCLSLNALSFALHRGSTPASYF